MRISSTVKWACCSKTSSTAGRLRDGDRPSRESFIIRIFLGMERLLEDCTT